MTNIDLARASVLALIARLEADPLTPLPADTMRDALSDGEHAALEYDARRQAAAQEADYLAATMPATPAAVSKFSERRQYFNRDYKGTLSARRSLLKRIAKLQARLNYQDTFIDEQWKFVWEAWDKLDPSEQAWFETPVTLSDRTATNLPAPLPSPPICAVLPDQMHWRVSAQLKALKRLLE